MRVLGALLLAAGAQAQQRNAVNLHVRLTVTPSDDKQVVLQEAKSLAAHAEKSGMGQTTQDFLRNLVQQVGGIIQAEEQLKAEEEKVPDAFTTPAMQVREMRKLRAKKETVKAVTFEDLQQQLKQGTLKDPVVVRDGKAFFPDWDAVRQEWTEKRLTENPALTKLQLEYFEQGQQREAVLVGNQIQMPEPKRVSFSGWFNRCFGKSKAPGAATEHCEQQVAAERLANASGLEHFGVFSELNNTLPLLQLWKETFTRAGSHELPEMLGMKQKQFREWQKQKGSLRYRHFVMGPSGSGEKLRAEDGLPFFDVLIHGSRRWLLVREKELKRVAKLAQEALEFQETTAYMFFEEKLPELKEEFGLKKYFEVNQNAGDMMVVPPGWYRVSLSLSDSISYYETMLQEVGLLRQIVEQEIFQPQLNRYDLAFCYDDRNLPNLPGFTKADRKKELGAAMRRVTDSDRVDFVVNSLVQCGGVLSLEDALPHLHPRRLTACTEQVWRDCRAKLASLVQGKSVTMDWLPQEAPTSPAQLGAPAHDEL